MSLLQCTLALQSIAAHRRLQLKAFQRQCITVLERAREHQSDIVKFIEAASEVDPEGDTVNGVLQVLTSIQWIIGECSKREVDPASIVYLSTAVRDMRESFRELVERVRDACDGLSKEEQLALSCRDDDIDSMDSAEDHAQLLHRVQELLVNSNTNWSKHFSGGGRTLDFVEEEMVALNDAMKSLVCAPFLLWYSATASDTGIKINNALHLCEDIVEASLPSVTIARVLHFQVDSDNASFDIGIDIHHPTTMLIRCVLFFNDDVNKCMEPTVQEDVEHNPFTDISALKSSGGVFLQRLSEGRFRLLVCHHKAGVSLAVRFEFACYLHLLYGSYEDTAETESGSPHVYELYLPAPRPDGPGPPSSDGPEESHKSDKDRMQQLAVQMRTMRVLRSPMVVRSIRKRGYARSMEWASSSLSSIVTATSVTPQGSSQSAVIDCTANVRAPNVDLTSVRVLGSRTEARTQRVTANHIYTQCSSPLPRAGSELYGLCIQVCVHVSRAVLTIWPGEGSFDAVVCAQMPVERVTEGLRSCRVPCQEFIFLVDWSDGTAGMGKRSIAILRDTLARCLGELCNSKERFKATVKDVPKSPVDLLGAPVNLRGKDTRPLAGVYFNVIFYGGAPREQHTLRKFRESPVVVTHTTVLDCQRWLTDMTQKLPSLGCRFGRYALRHAVEEEFISDYVTLRNIFFFSSGQFEDSICPNQAPYAAACTWESVYDSLRTRRTRVFGVAIGGAPCHALYRLCRATHGFKVDLTVDPSDYEHPSENVVQLMQMALLASIATKLQCNAPFVGVGIGAHRMVPTEVLSTYTHDVAFITRFGVVPAAEENFEELLPIQLLATTASRGVAQGRLAETIPAEGERFGAFDSLWSRGTTVMSEPSSRAGRTATASPEGRGVSEGLIGLSGHASQSLIDESSILVTVIPSTTATIEGDDRLAILYHGSCGAVAEGAGGGEVLLAAKQIIDTLLYPEGHFNTSMAWQDALLQPNLFQMDKEDLYDFLRRDSGPRIDIEGGAHSADATRQMEDYEGGESRTTTAAALFPGSQFEVIDILEASFEEDALHDLVGRL